MQTHSPCFYPTTRCKVLQSAGSHPKYCPQEKNRKEEERKELKKSLKLTNKSNLELLQKYSLEEQKIRSLPIVKKYLSLFTKSYKFSEVSKIIGKSESAVRRLKQESFLKLRKLAKERKLHFLMA